MILRFRTVLGLTLLLTLLTTITVFAKGSFAFITIAGPDMKDPIRSTDPALTTDFFAFADFSRSAMKAPTDPGVSYEIKRYYIDGGRESAFDHLHYYPETGYVFFDGLMGGSSEYDGKWYKAQSAIKEVFAKALIPVSPVKPEPQASIPQPQSIEQNTVTTPASPMGGNLPITLISVVVGLAVVAVFAYWRRRPFVERR